MQIKEISDKKIWNSFLDENNYLSFLQDFEYGEMEKELGREIFRFGIFEKNELVGVCQLIGYQAKRGNVLIIPHGPVIKSNSSTNQHEDLFEGVKLIIEEIKKRNLNKKYAFLRINSSIPYDEEKLKKFYQIGFRYAPVYSVTENFWLKDLRKDIFEGMKNSCKKQIEDSLKKPYLEIEKTTELHKFEIFWEIYQDLAKRKKFIPYPYEYIKKEFEIFSKENKALLFLGKAEGKYYAGALIIFSHQIAFYHHGASLITKEPIEYKLHYEVIQEAKKRGCYFYNFWGVAKNDDPQNPWYGFSQFKKSFGGELIKFLPAIDYKFSWKYWIISLVEKLKRKRN